jgi:hypothetical protein
VPRTLRHTKVLVAAVALVVIVVAVLVVRARSDQGEQVAQYVVPDTAGKTTGQAQAFTEALRKRGLVCSDLFPDYKPLLVRTCSRKDATHDVYADFAATPDGQLSAAELGAKYDFPASAADAQTELKAIAGEFAVAGAADGLTELLGKYSNQVSAPITTAWGTVTVVGDTGVELERKGWKWPELPDDPFVGTAEQVVNAVTADGFTCTSGGGPHVQNCVRATDLVTAISADDGIHTIGIRAGSWTAARTLQEHIFRALTGSGEPVGDRRPLATDWFAAGEAAGARAYVDGLQLCQTKYDSNTVFEITALVPFGSRSNNC